jgi:metal-dependent hydrolase (beta-lactamase superfamily II)
LLVEERYAEIPHQRVFEENNELNPQRLIQPKLFCQKINLVLSKSRAPVEKGYWITGEEPEENKIQNNDSENGQYSAYGTPQNV